MKDLLNFLNQVQVTISHLLQDGDIADNEVAQSTAKNLLSEAERLQNKYSMPVTQEHTKDCGWHSDWHNCNCGAFNK